MPACPLDRAGACGYIGVSETEGLPMKYLAILVCALALAACAPVESGEPSTNAPQPGDLVDSPLGDRLVEREPDLCKASTYQQYIGQPGTIVPTLGITRVYRVIEFGGIVTQEYNPSRLNFRLSPTGEIQRIDCG